MRVDVSTLWPYLITAAFVAVLAWRTRQQPARPETRCLAWMIRLSFVGAIAAAAATVLRSPDLRYGLWAVQILILLVQAPLTLVFSLEYAGYEQWLSRRTLALLAIPALVFVALVVILPRDRLAEIRVYAGQEVFVASRVMLWGGTVAHFGIWLVSVAVLVECLVNAPAFRLATLLIITAHLIPRVAYLAAEGKSSPASPAQAAVLATGISALLYFVALTRYQLLHVSPVAREVAMNHMPYGVLVLDRDNRLVDINRAAHVLLGLPARRPSRQTATDVLGAWWEHFAPLICQEPVGQDIVTEGRDPQRIIHVHSLPLVQRNGWRIGQVLMLSDVTEVRRAEREHAQTLWAHATLQEREQLAHELHDGLSQSLGFLSLQAQAAQVYLDTGRPDACHAALGRLTEAAEEIHEETRELIGDLLAVSPLAENFGTALQHILAAFRQQTGLEVHLQADGASADAKGPLGESGLPRPVAVQLVRITQEALANVRKHACGASQVRVQLRTSDGVACLTIEDDGPGFSAEARPLSGKHFGLQVMRQRAERVGGQVTVYSEFGKGTRIEARVPLVGDEVRGAR